MVDQPEHTPSANTNHARLYRAAMVLVMAMMGALSVVFAYLAIHGGAGLLRAAQSCAERQASLPDYSSRYFGFAVQNGVFPSLYYLWASAALFLSLFHFFDLERETPLSQSGRWSMRAAIFLLATVTWLVYYGLTNAVSA